MNQTERDESRSHVSVNAEIAEDASGEMRLQLTATNPPAPAQGCIHCNIAFTPSGPDGWCECECHRSKPPASVAEEGAERGPLTPDEAITQLRRALQVLESIPDVELESAIPRARVLLRGVIGRGITPDLARVSAGAGAALQPLLDEWLNARLEYMNCKTVSSRRYGAASAKLEEALKQKLPITATPSLSDGIERVREFERNNPEVAGDDFANGQNSAAREIITALESMSSTGPVEGDNGSE